MDIIKNLAPGYKVNEYKIVIDPHQELSHKIAEIRKEFNEEYRVEPKVGSRVNLALATFTQYEMREDRIIAHLKKIALGYPPFKVELKDFGSFPTHSIFINVTSKVPLQELVKQVRTETQRLMKLDNEHKPYFILEPYFAIANKLKPWQYEKGWLAYSNKHFSGRFIADSMLLLKRTRGESAWKIAERFEFQNMPVNIKQGELFI